MRPTTLTNTVLITGRTNDKQTIFDKNYIKLFCREVQETNEHSKKRMSRVKKSLVNSKRNKSDRRLEHKQRINKNIILQWRVWSWLRMNASYRLTHASRGAAMKKACFLQAATGARVSNAYRTCLILRNSLAKVRLMPDVIRVSHDILIKDLSVWDGDASH